MDVNSFLDSSNISEFVVWSFSDSRLLLLGSDDLAYYHQIEIIYHDVEYIDAPISFWKPRFRAATEEETRLFRAGKGASTTASLHVIEDNSDGVITIYLIAAERCSVVTGMVYHYDRASLQPGERIASWVHR